MDPDVVPAHDQVYRQTAGLLRSFIEKYPFVPAIRDAFLVALRADGKLLSERPLTCWPLFVYTGSVAVGGDWQKTLPVGAAAEMIGVATDLADDVVDGDQSAVVEAYGPARALNLACLTFATAWRMLDSQPDRVRDALWQGVVAAAGGQHDDLGATPSTPEEYIEIVDRKAGALVSALVLAGALAAKPDVDRRSLEVLGTVGRLLGRCEQLKNDLWDVWFEGQYLKGDARRGKLSLPHIFALRNALPSKKRLVQRLAAGKSLSPAQRARLHHALWQSGALHYTLVTAESARDAAEESLQSICPLSASAIIEWVIPS